MSKVNKKEKEKLENNIITFNALCKSNNSENRYKYNIYKTIINLVSYYSNGYYKIETKKHVIQISDNWIYIDHNKIHYKHIALDKVSNNILNYILNVIKIDINARLAQGTL